LEPHQTFKEQQIDHQRNPEDYFSDTKLQEAGITRRAKQQGQTQQPLNSERGFITPETLPPNRYTMHHDMVDTDLEEKMEQQQDDIEEQYAFDIQQEIDKNKETAKRFGDDLGEHLPPYRANYPAVARTFGGAGSSTDDPEATHEPRGKPGRPPRPTEPIIPSVESTHEPRGKPGRPQKVAQTEPVIAPPKVAKSIFKRPIAGAKPLAKAKAKAVAKATVKAVGFDVYDAEMEHKESMQRVNEAISPQQGHRRKRIKTLTKEQSDEKVKLAIERGIRNSPPEETKKEPEFKKNEMARGRRTSTNV
jgi:hypothetical protein